MIEAYQNRKFVDDIEYLQKRFGSMDLLAKELQTDLDKGIKDSQEELLRRVDQFGTNRKDPPIRTSYWKVYPPHSLTHILQFFCKALDDFILKVLLVCACIDIAFEMGFSDHEERSKAWIEGFAIFLAVFLVVFVGSFNDYRKEEQFFKLYALD